MRVRQGWGCGLLLAAGLAVAGAGTAGAADILQVFNLTTNATLDGVYLAPAGSTGWGPNQALNDKDHTVEPNERLRLRGVQPGRYDVKLHAQGGATCVKHNVDLTHDKSFDVRDADLSCG